VKDFLSRALVVVGGSDRNGGRTRRFLIRQPEREALPRRSAHGGDDQVCLQRVSCAQKSALPMKIGSLAEVLGLMPEEVLDTLCRDRKLNISAAYLNRGSRSADPACPRIWRALRYRAARLDLKLPLLESVLPSNDEHLRRAIQSSLDLGRSSWASCGLAFKEKHRRPARKPGGGNARAPAWKRGSDLRVYDPHIQMDKIYALQSRLHPQRDPAISASS